MTEYKVTVQRSKTQEVKVEADTREEALTKAVQESRTTEPKTEKVEAWVSGVERQWGQYL